MNDAYIPLEIAANEAGISKKSLLNLSYCDKKHGRSDRFIVSNGFVYVHANYKCPHFDELAELYYKARVVASSDMEIAKFISRRTGKKVANIALYLRNFKFKNPDFARIVAKLLRIYIKQNSLFGDELNA